MLTKDFQKLIKKNTACANAKAKNKPIKEARETDFEQMASSIIDEVGINEYEFLDALLSYDIEGAKKVSLYDAVKAIKDDWDEVVRSMEQDDEGAGDDKPTGEEFKSGDKVRIVNINHFDASDFGMDRNEYRKLLSHEGSIAKVIDIATDGYYDVEFDDGYEVQAISTYHMKKV